MVAVCSLPSVKFSPPEMPSIILAPSSKMTTVQYFSTRDAFDNIGSFLGMVAVFLLVAIGKDVVPRDAFTNIDTFFTDVDGTVSFH